MTRPTPFDLVFHDLASEFPALRDGAARMGRDVRDHTEFAHVPEVQRLLERLAAPELVAQHPEAAAEYLALLFVGYRFWEAGKHVIQATREQLAPAMSRIPPATPPDVPGGACYVQLPAQWIWAQAAEDGPHEPLDGVFLAAGPRGDEITVVAILGFRAERVGFTQVTLHARPDEFVLARTERRSPPFAPVMTGGATAGFLSVANQAELLTLAHLALSPTGE
jgi:hypothetical protein